MKKLAFILFVFMMVGCKKEEDPYTPVNITLSLKKATTNLYKITTRTIIDDTTSINDDRDETTIDTMTIAYSTDTLIGSEIYFTKTEIYKGNTNIYLLKETDSNYWVVAKWEVIEQAFISVEPYVDIIKKLKINSTWSKFIYNRVTDFKVTGLTTVIASNKLFSCAKVVPLNLPPQLNYTDAYYYGSEGLVKVTYHSKNKLDFGSIEQIETIELF